MFRLRMPRGCLVVLVCLSVLSPPVRAKYVTLKITNNSGHSADDFHIVGIKDVKLSSLQVMDRPVATFYLYSYSGTNSNDGDGKIDFEMANSLVSDGEKVEVTLNFDSGKSSHCKGFFQWTTSGDPVGSPGTLPAIDTVERLGGSGSTAAPGPAGNGGDTEQLVLWVVNPLDYTNLHVYTDVPDDYWQTHPSLRPPLTEIAAALPASGTFHNGDNVLADLGCGFDGDWYATFDAGGVTVGFGEEVPEPAALALLLTGALPLVRRRRQRRNSKAP